MVVKGEVLLMIGGSSKEHYDGKIELGDRFNVAMGKHTFSHNGLLGIGDEDSAPVHVHILVIS